MNRIGLIDCNNFFVSCERLFRPDLAKKPVAVLSSNDGCIVARSQEVKDLGIPMGAPYFQVRDICKAESVVLFSSNFALYRDISRRVMRILTEEFAAVEIYSVDEAFFLLPREMTKEMTKKQLAGIRARVFRDVGIPVSIGIAATKTIAKCAAGIAKQGSGISVLNERAWKKVRGGISCGSVWGIGRQTAAKLTTVGVHTVEEFLALDRAYVQKQFGVSGMRTRMELAGISVYTVGERCEVEQQSIMSSRSFSETTSSLKTLESAVGHHVSELATKLRNRGFVAARVYVSVRPSRHSHPSHGKCGADSTLTKPSDSTRELLKEALKLLGEIYDDSVPYKKAEVVLGGLMPADSASGSLFADSQTERTGTDAAVDAINARYGSGTVRPAVVYQAGGIPARATLRSGAYTTDWQALRTVSA